MGFRLLQIGGHDLPNIRIEDSQDRGDAENERRNMANVGVRAEKLAFGKGHII